MTHHASRGRGFTIVELMVSLAVASILIGIAIPAFNDFIRQRTMTTRINDMVLAITYARSEAVRRGGIVSVTAADPEDDNEWGGGYCVVEGTPGNCAGAVLRSFDPTDDATLNAVGALQGVNALRFNSRGMVQGNIQGTIRLCSNDAGVDPGRIVTLNAVGRADVADLECN